jgi:hypothetical protein
MSRHGALRLVVALALTLSANVAPTKAVQSAGPEVRMMPSGADLLSYADTLVEIRVADGADRTRQLRVSLDARDVTRRSRSGRTAAIWVW